ncbi:ribonuclease HII [Oceanobacillus halotolerans]|uniref:ribonuclease HII n=1 Tax=Oceanobacillus halotolerans TaxID=2663380 RepID=UPI0013DCA055|nr:ribonuclease HII [Oceanobacillus halotolerans]
MEQQSIAVLKQLFQQDKIKESQLKQLKKDPRKGVQQLVKAYEKKLAKVRQLEFKFKEMSRIEDYYYDRGYHYIAGMDEAGRGPLAGPVVAACVVLPKDFKLLGLNDSKQLTEATRTEFFTIIKKEAISYGISMIDNRTIDNMNIYEATKLAMLQAMEQLDPQPNHMLIDAVELEGLTCTYDAITKGDAKSISIAAASILAKVTRDNRMKEIHSEYPEYDFSSNMGYGTKQHMEALARFGASPYHRRSFAPVRNVTKC